MYKANGITYSFLMAQSEARRIRACIYTLKHFQGQVTPCPCLRVGPNSYCDSNPCCDTWLTHTDGLLTVVNSHLSRDTNVYKKHYIAAKNRTRKF